MARRRNRGAAREKASIEAVVGMAAVVAVVLMVPQFREAMWRLLARVMEPAQVGRWLRSPQPAFDGSTPLQVVERGEMDRIWHMLYDLGSGQPG